MEPETLQGRLEVLYAFEVGREIELRRCREILTDVRRIPQARKRPAPSLFGLAQSPLVWLAPETQVEFAGRRCRVGRRVVIYEFGSISVSLELELEGQLPGWRHTAIELSEPQALDDLARATRDELIERIGQAIAQMRVSARMARHVVYQLDRVPGNDTAEWLRAHEMEIAQILRLDDIALSRDQLRDTLAKRVSYGVDDLVVVDYAATLVVDSEYADTLAVLDFANIELLSLQNLDESLDDALATANHLIRSPTHRIRSLVKPYGKPVRDLVALTADRAAEFEAVDNAIKLTEDHYLGRVYRLAAERYHLAALDTDITRKLQTLWNIHNIFIERSSSRRSELLEWMIILLIAVDIIAVLEW